MTPENKEKCLALAVQWEAVQKLPGGTEFITDMVLTLLERGGLVAADKTELERLRAALTPFAALGSRLAGNNHDAAPITQCFFHSPGIEAITAEKLKAAHAAMQG